MAHSSSTESEESEGNQVEKMASLPVGFHYHRDLCLKDRKLEIGAVFAQVVVCGLQPLAGSFCWVCPHRALFLGLALRKVCLLLPCVSYGHMTDCGQWGGLCLKAGVRFNVEGQATAPRWVSDRPVPLSEGKTEER